MAFEIVSTLRGSGLAKQPGLCRMSKSGATTFHQEDLNAVSIQDKATLLVDRDALQFALCAPIKDEPTIVVGRANKQCKNMRKVATRSATNMLGLPSPARLISLAVKIQGGMLIVQLDRRDFEASPATSPDARVASPAQAKAADGPHPTKQEIPFADLRPPSTTAKRR